MMRLSSAMYRAVDGLFHPDPTEEFATHCVCGDELKGEEKMLGLCFWCGFQRAMDMKERASE